MSTDLEFIGGPLDGETHEVEDTTGQVTRIAVISPPQMAVYDRRVSPTSGKLAMVWTEFRLPDCG